MLAQNPNDLDALRQIASIDRNIHKYDEAKATEMKIISLDPKDAEANYTIGYIDWTESYKNATDILAAAGLQDDGQAMSRSPKLSARNSSPPTQTWSPMRRSIWNAPSRSIPPTTTLCRS